jgi:hypothetical protein
MFEQVVRPFQAPAPAPRRRIVVEAVSAPSDDTATLTWGSAGSVPGGSLLDPGEDTTADGYNWRVECCRNTWNQANVDTSDLTVTNPDDATQYVVVRRINSIAFQSGQNQCNNPDVNPIFDVHADDWAIGSGFAALARTDQCNATYNLNY